MKKYEELVIKLFQTEIIAFGEYEFKLHEEYPLAPKSLMKLNLRKPPNGKLTDEIITEIGKLYVDIAYRNLLKFNLIAGLPAAGDPLAEAFVANNGVGKDKLIFLEKENLPGGKRRISSQINGQYGKREVVLGIDDALTLGGTKGEAIEAILRNDLYITNFICFMDWGLGAKKALFEKYGVKVITTFTVEDILLIGQNNNLLEPERRTAVLERRDKIKEHIENNEPILSA